MAAESASYKRITSRNAAELGSYTSTKNMERNRFHIAEYMAKWQQNRLHMRITSRKTAEFGLYGSIKNRKGAESASDTRNDSRAGSKIKEKRVNT